MSHRSKKYSDLQALNRRLKNTSFEHQSSELGRRVPVKPCENQNRVELNLTQKLGKYIYLQYFDFRFEFKAERLIPSRS